jgi:indole-3-glycerol phosphate synthase
MDILEQIIARKRNEVEERKALYPVKLLEKSVFYNSPGVSLCKYLLREDKEGIIAEIKRKSPSKGVINKYVSIERTSIGYMQAGASALSILTDTDFFGGKNEDLSTARKYNYCPILRKDFIVDEYQVIETKSIGADVILLLANVLSPVQTKELARFARSLGLEVLLEIREEAELGAINEYVDAVGVNNRNLKDFKVNMDQSFKLGPKIPTEFVRVSESGLSTAQQIIDLREAGFRGFLMGETFMKNSRPEQVCAQFIRDVRACRELAKK